jgi:hypothetical protein
LLRSSTVIDHLQTPERDWPVAFYFFDFNNQAKRTAIGCMYSIALQLCEQSSILHKSITALYEQCQGGSCDIHGLRQAIGCILRDLPKSFIVIDALDECLPEDDERGRVVSCLEHIQATAKESRLFVSSRTEPDIASALEELGATNVSMHHLEVDKDIRVYVRSRLSKDKSLKKWNQRVKDEIEGKVVSKSKGM